MKDKKTYRYKAYPSMGCCYDITKGSTDVSPDIMDTLRSNDHVRIERMEVSGSVEATPLCETWQEARKAGEIDIKNVPVIAVRERMHGAVVDVEDSKEGALLVSSPFGIASMQKTVPHKASGDYYVASHNDAVCACEGHHGVARTARPFTLAFADGEASVAQTVDVRCVAASDGDASGATCDGSSSVAASVGSRGIASTFAYGAVAATTGDGSVSCATGTRSVAVSTCEHGRSRADGMQTVAVGVGDRADSKCEGLESVAVALGMYPSASCANAGSVALAVGQDARARATHGKEVGGHPVAIACGNGACVCGEAGCMLVLIDQDHSVIRSLYVGEGNIKADVWYGFDETGLVKEYAAYVQK